MFHPPTRHNWKTLLLARDNEFVVETLGLLVADEDEKAVALECLGRFLKLLLPIDLPRLHAVVVARAVGVEDFLGIGRLYQALNTVLLRGDCNPALPDKCARGSTRAR